MDNDAEPRSCPSRPHDDGASAARALSKAAARVSRRPRACPRGRATTRLDIERQAELGRAVVADRLATLERIGLDRRRRTRARDRRPRAAKRALPRRRPARFWPPMSIGRPCGGARGSRGRPDRRASRGGRSRAGPEAIFDRLTALFYLASRRAGRERAGLGDRRRSARGGAGGRQRGRRLHIAALDVLEPGGTSISRPNSPCAWARPVGAQQHRDDDAGRDEGRRQPGVRDFFASGSTVRQRWRCL